MRRLPGLALAVLAAAGCRPADDPLVSYRLFVMATWVDIRLPESAVAREPDLIAKLESGLRDFETDYYAWADGELAALNRALTRGQSFEPSDALGALLETAAGITQATGGAFDPGVGALVELWGFNGDEPRDTPPDQNAIAAALESTGSIAEVRLDGGNHNRAVRVVAPSPEDGRQVARRFTLDLGGIAKGAAVDSIVAELDHRGVAPALVNAGGDLRVVGRPTDRDWRIGIAAPRGEGMLGTIRLFDHEAAFTSGDYERFFEHQGERFHHILDPRTGMPVTHTQAVTVIAANGTIADAAATALFVAGPGAWLQTATALGIEAALRVDATGRIEMTATMRDRLEPDAEARSDIIAAVD